MSKLKLEISKDKVLSALQPIIDPDSGKSVVESGIISSIVIKESSVGFALEVDINKAEEKETLRKTCENAVRKIEGVNSVTVVMTSSQPGAFSSPRTPLPANKVQNNNAQLPVGKNIPNVKNIILVASGKGGVGKSTVAVNLARKLSSLGHKVGLVDADIYGPSIPKMLGLKGKPSLDDKNKIIPKESEGIKSVSIGYLIEEDNALVWRASMAIKAMNQLMLGVSWGQLDYLIVDTPPGTGDIQLSLCKSYDINGVVVVSTPQEVALIDVKKAITMFRKINVPILGIVQNMSYFEDDRGKKNYIFGEGGAKNLAKDMDIPFLGEIPIDPNLRESADMGKPADNLLLLDKIALKFKKELEKLNG
ncbi:MAG: Mrp/NBP35 family ATP-binding protein [Rickettsiales bacterium]|nr:Mrp/NBP35 family ATP-binding protein [Pseudomonadota bacterium]MDA0966427.1 Mrp/NBP35 family ATP-binding protein [Pseudomonadota bacterium]MDG4543289.1 Mrp/NBP35 family ATP-binding protein [Rickettsiales bacterium]MDG4545555.1 Mrp/NBP35 family ATP-binding protein [Rickettsiales bacterium]MDG4548004.1 Mrp/NBP35 family ATP-binding protein [Rickettsiales bacterium]